MAEWYAPVFLAIVIATSASGASVRSPPSHLKLDNVHVPWMLMPDDEGKLHVAYLVETSPRESTNITEEVILLLYTRSNAATGPYRLYANDVNNLKASGYDPSHPTEILIHGFTSNGQSSVIIGSKDAYLSKGEYNVIGVDWGVLCPSPLYVEACQNAVLVGELLAELIEFLVAEGGAQLQDFHVTGHSLGAQVAGFTGSNTKSGKVGRITGLDAAYPMFGNADASGRLDATDGVLVDAIHTCGGSLGFEEPIALVDFYPNGGLRPQPGCDNDVTGSCSHGKSVSYFINSILNEKAYPAVECLSLEEAESGTCTGTSTGYMGEAIQYGNPGLYYTDTTQ
ncbi:lipase member H-like [Periplaneta americana]|uniref:lipase member H-like n=1 Tax=Periplaneta americana TaxID=6978 RepID=UPI0037E95325